MRPTFYIDLDRTTFRTERVKELYDELVRLYPDNLAVAEGYKRRGDYYVLSDAHDGDGDQLYCHDFAAQLRVMGLEPSVVFARLQERLGDGRFEYDGTAELVALLRERGNVVVLTYGTDDYQRCKAALCPSLRDLSCVTVLEPKSAYLNEHAKTGDWMIDDKVLMNVKAGVRVVRVGHGERAQRGVTHSLYQVADMIRESVDG